MYLEPIFGMGALPAEQGRFRRVEEEFRDIMAKVGTGVEAAMRSFCHCLLVRCCFRPALAFRFAFDLVSL